MVKTTAGSLTSSAQAARDSASGAPGASKAPRASRVQRGRIVGRAYARSRPAPGAQIAGEFLQHRDKPDPATLIGKGKLEEIAGAAASVSADLLLFDHDLSASQQRNIEKIVNIRVIDRTQLILDIFRQTCAHP